MIAVNRNPSARELKQFGGIWLGFFSLAAGAYWYRGGDEAFALAVWGAAVFAALTGFVFPAWMRLLFVGMSYLAFPIGWAVSHLLLALVYYLVLTPIGLILKILGRDPLQRRADPSASSYWKPLAEIKDANRYFRQF